MNKPLSTAELAAIEAAHPVTDPTPPPPKMTRREKLLRWASLVEAHTGALSLYHRLEHWGASMLDEGNLLSRHGYDTAVTLALRDPMFKAEGLGDSMRSVIGYFELDQQGLHTMSCDCGGAISNTDAAARLRRLAA